MLDNTRGKKRKKPPLTVIVSYALLLPNPSLPERIDLQQELPSGRASLEREREIPLPPSRSISFFLTTPNARTECPSFLKPYVLHTHKGETRNKQTHSKLIPLSTSSDTNLATKRVSSQPHHSEPKQNKKAKEGTKPKNNNKNNNEKKPVTKHPFKKTKLRHHHNQNNSLLVLLLRFSFPFSSCKLSLF